MQCASEALGGCDSSGSCGSDTGNNHTHFDIDGHADRDRVIDPTIIALVEELDDATLTDRGRKEESFIVALTAAEQVTNYWSQSTNHLNIDDACGDSPPKLALTTKQGLAHSARRNDRMCVVSDSESTARPKLNDEADARHTMRQRNCSAKLVERCIDQGVTLAAKLGIPTGLKLTSSNPHP